MRRSTRHFWKTKGTRLKLFLTPSGWSKEGRALRRKLKNLDVDRIHQEKGQKIFKEVGEEMGYNKKG